MICPKCNRSNNDSAQFCAGCGSKLIAASSKQQNHRQFPDYGQQPYGQNYNRQNYGQNHKQPSTGQNYDPQSYGQNYNQQDSGWNHKQQSHGQNHIQQPYGQNHNQQPFGQQMDSRFHQGYNGQPNRSVHKSQKNMRGRKSGNLKKAGIISIGIAAAVFIAIFVGGIFGSGHKTADVTMMAYFIGSDLEHDSGILTFDLEEMKSAQPGDDINVIVQTGGCSDWKNDYVEDGVVQRFELVDQDFKELDNLGVVSMVEPDTLTDFINYTVENYPAEKYVLVLGDHGGGIPISFGSDDLFPDKMMSIIEIKNAVENSGIHCHSVIFDACLMSTLEVAYALQDVTDYIVASENPSWGSSDSQYTFIDYTDVLNDLSMEDKESTYYLEQISKEYMRDVDTINKTGSMSVIKTKKVQDVYEAYTKYIEEVINAVIDDGRLGEYIAARESAEIGNALSSHLENLGTTSDTVSYNDSVDMINLANAFKTDSSAHLIAAVNNVFLNRDTNSTSLNGLAAYSPYYGTDVYDEGRGAMTDLHYDESITFFYDNFVSFIQEYKYGRSGESTDWWSTDLLQLYSYNTSSSVQVCAAEPEDDGSGGRIWRVDNDYISNIYTELIVNGSGGTNDYGRFITYAEDGYINIEGPEVWTAVETADGEFSFIYFYGTDEYEDTEGNIYSGGYTYAYVNGELMGVTLTFNYDIKEYEIQELIAFDEEGNISGTYIPAEDTEFEFGYISESNGFVPTTSPTTISNFRIYVRSINLDNVDFKFQIIIRDIYDETHESGYYVYN